MRAFLSITVSGALTAPALAAEMNVSIEIPKLNVAEYHRPYVAIWLEKPDQSFRRHSQRSGTTSAAGTTKARSG